MANHDSLDGVKPEQPETEQLETIVSCNIQLFKYNGFWFDLPMMSVELIDEIRVLDVRPDDVLVASFPKSGTTWTQEIVWQLLRQKDGVQLACADGNIDERFPMLEFNDPSVIVPTVNEIARRESPRLMKTHVPYNSIPEGFTRGLGKVIYIARNPKDVCVSLYYFYRMLEDCQFRGTFEELVDAFIKGEVMFGAWIDHVTGFWQQRNQSNILRITYESLQKDGLKTVREIANFLDVSLTEEQLCNVYHKCSFQKMKENPKTNYLWWEQAGFSCKEQSTFMRKGVVGDWVSHFTQDEAAKFDQLFDQRLEQLGIYFACSPSQ